MKVWGPLHIEQLSERDFPRTWEVMRAGVAENVTPGMVAGFWDARRPGVAVVGATGFRRRIPDPQPMDAATVFDFASITKVFATATLTARLIERGWISWDTELRELLPVYPHSGIRLRHLLSHTSGLPAWSPFYERIREHFAPLELSRVPVLERQHAMRRLVFSVPPDVKPGVRAVYSDLSFLLLGFALEELTGLTLDEAVSRYVWRPMGIRDAFFRRTTAPAREARLNHVAATEVCPWRGELQGQVHDDNCWSMGGYSGHAGAFGRIGDLLLFSRELMSGFLMKPTLDVFWTRVSEPAGCDRTPGWDTPSGPMPAAGRLFSSRTVGHTGFTGTSLWIDRDARLAVALLTNRVHPTRDNDRIKAFRPRFHDALRADLVHLPR